MSQASTNILQQASNTVATLQATTNTITTPASPLATTANAAINQSQAEQIAQAQAAQATVSSNVAGLTNAITQAATTGNSRDLNVIDVPGVTPFIGANVNNALTPNVVTPSKPSTKINQQSVSSSALEKQKPKK
jgi:hypothetical protein